MKSLNRLQRLSCITNKANQIKLIQPSRSLISSYNNELKSLTIKSFSSDTKLLSQGVSQNQNELSNDNLYEIVNKIVKSTQSQIHDEINTTIVNELQQLNFDAQCQVLQSLNVNRYSNTPQLVHQLNLDLNHPKVITVQLQYWSYRLLNSNQVSELFDECVQNWQKQYLKLVEFQLVFTPFQFDLVFECLNDLTNLSRDPKYLTLLINHIKIHLERNGEVSQNRQDFGKLIDTLIKLQLDKDLHVTFLNQLNELMLICRYKLADDKLIIGLIYACLPKSPNAYSFNRPAIYQPDTIHRLHHLQLILREHSFLHNHDTRMAILRTIACAGSTHEFFGHWQVAQRLNLPNTLYAYQQLFWICQGRPKESARAISHHLPRLAIEHPDIKYPLSLLQATLWCGTLTKDPELFRQSYDFVASHMVKYYRWTSVQLDSIISFRASSQVKAGTLAEIQRVKYQGIEEEIDHFKGMSTLFRMEIDLTAQLRGITRVKEIVVEAFDYFRDCGEQLPFAYEVDDLGSLHIEFIQGSNIPLSSEISSILGSLASAYYKAKQIQETLDLIEKIHSYSVTLSEPMYFPSKPIQSVVRWAQQTTLADSQSFHKYQGMKAQGIFEDLLFSNFAITLTQHYLDPRTIPAVSKRSEAWEAYQMNAV